MDISPITFELTPSVFDPAGEVAAVTISFSTRVPDNAERTLDSEESHLLFRWMYLAREKKAEKRA